ncbi:hypothetical protein DIPPA_25386 [Diplonema papillatum]|nr:hypothetical protein DIPPA_25386 [Diplonema papillatum]
MLLFSLVHKLVFGAREYTRGLQVGARIVRGAVLPTAKQGICTNLRRTLKHEDIKNDILATWSTSWPRGPSLEASEKRTNLLCLEDSNI